MPKLAISCGGLRRIAILTSCSLMLGLAGCSNGRGSVDSGGEGGAPPPAQPANPTYTVNGTISGLAGSGLVLQLNGAGDTPITRDGPFAFPNALASGTTYAVTVATQPSNPAQVCSISNGTGTIGSENVTNVTVVCSTQSFNVGGSVSGLEGRGLVLRLNGSTDLPVASNGAFTFPDPIASGSPYEITVVTQPSSPAQTCTVANASGVIGSGTSQSAEVTCATNAYALGGTVIGLEGDRLVLSNSNETVEIEADGTFTFPTKIASGGSYNVTVQREPTNPAQACTVTNGSGTVDAADITNVSVSCTRRAFTIGGTVGGLAGRGLVLRNNDGDDLSINADGTFRFATAVESGRTYAVSVAADPTSPRQRCVVENGSGTVTNANVTDIRVQCTTIEYTVGGRVSGLAGSGLVLLNNGGDNLAVAADGPFTFATSLETGSMYDVTVGTQPRGPSQVCSVSDGAGRIDGANVTNVAVSCETSSFPINVTVAGLRGFSLRIRNNASDTLLIHSNGIYTFREPVLSGATYNVTIDGGPIFPFQTCTVTNGTGTVGDGPVEVAIACQ